MKSSSKLKSVRDLRTSLSIHSRTRPRGKGPAFLELYLLNREKTRLKMDLEELQKQEVRLRKRLGEIQKLMTTLMEMTDVKDSGENARRLLEATFPEFPSLKKVCIDY
jgi:hypothetical protein